MNRIRMKNNKTISLVNDCQGYVVSPKQPQSLLHQISRIKGQNVKTNHQKQTPNSILICNQSVA
jgi:proteasome assembly chaperone (PAC2) family protein